MANSIFTFSDVHTIATSTELEATRGGAHIWDAVATADMDNGVIVTVGDYDAAQLYEYTLGGGDADTINGTIVRKEDNGIYQIKVDSVKNVFAGVVISVPIIKMGFNKLTNGEKFFYNAEGEIVRIYQLTAGDVFGITAEGFDGTPVVGKSVTVNTTTGKLTVGA